MLFDLAQSSGLHHTLAHGNVGTLVGNRSLHQPGSQMSWVEPDSSFWNNPSSACSRVPQGRPDLCKGTVPSVSAPLMSTHPLNVSPLSMSQHWDHEANKQTFGSMPTPHPDHSTQQIAADSR